MNASPDFHPLGEPRPSRSRATRWACLAAAATLAALIVLGHDGRRIAQLLVLAAPAVAWLLWPIRSAAMHRIRMVVVWCVAMVFVLDSALRGYIVEAYHAAPDSAFVQAAAANTHAREAGEYLATHWRSLAIWSGAVVVAGLILARSVRRGARQVAWQRTSVGIIAAALMLGTVAHLSKPWRRLHPVVFWSTWSHNVSQLRSTWTDLQSERDRALDRAHAVAPVITRTGPSTVVLVITDSVNRDNMALYGYERATTPRLLAQKSLLQDQMLVMRHAWSVDASTLPALRNLFHFGQPAGGQPQHVLALARAAGFKVWWISNHDDTAIEQQHARLADVTDLINRVPGRAGASLDGELLDEVQGALKDAAERKLIVVHLIGAHPHYNLRFPVGGNPFDDRIDGVEAGLEKNGRSSWVRKFRQEYDAALLYHDFVVAETLEMTRRADDGAIGHRAWMYLSDHGQEVGHGSNRVGHSPATASGYRIPTVIWRNSPLDVAGQRLGERPFRADWAAYTLADLLNLDWTGKAGQRNVLASDYQWLAPQLPVTVEDFSR